MLPASYRVYVCSREHPLEGVDFIPVLSIFAVTCNESCLDFDSLTGCIQCRTGYESPHCCSCAPGYVRLGDECVGRLC